jgi:hypothetical protein
MTHPRETLPSLYLQARDLYRARVFASPLSERPGRDGAENMKRGYIRGIVGKNQTEILARVGLLMPAIEPMTPKDTTADQRSRIANGLAELRTNQLNTSAVRGVFEQVMGSSPARLPTTRQLQQFVPALRASRSDASLVSQFNNRVERWRAERWPAWRLQRTTEFVRELLPTLSNEQHQNLAHELTQLNLNDLTEANVAARFRDIAGPAGSAIDLNKKLSDDNDAPTALTMLTVGRGIFAVVSDFNLAGRTCEELLGEVRRLAPKCMRVLVSETIPLDEAKDLGLAEAFIQRPWPSGKLRQTVDAILFQWLSRRTAPPS